MSEKKTTTNRMTYFHMKCRYLDSDELVFDEVSTALDVGKFVDVKRIVTLDAFFLEYHSRRSEMRVSLIERDRRFVFLLSVQYLQYHGNAFFMKKRKMIEVPVKSWIMIDAAFFRENNLNYVRSRISELIEKHSLSAEWYNFESEKLIKSNDVKSSQMNENALLLCSSIVREWSFGNKLWRELFLSLARQWHDAITSWQSSKLSLQWIILSTSFEIHRLLSIWRSSFRKRILF